MALQRASSKLCEDSRRVDVKGKGKGKQSCWLGGKENRAAGWARVREAAWFARLHRRRDETEKGKRGATRSKEAGKGLSCRRGPGQGSQRLSLMHDTLGSRGTGDRDGAKAACVDPWPAAPSPEVQKSKVQTASSYGMRPRMCGGKGAKGDGRATPRRGGNETPAIAGGLCHVGTEHVAGMGQREL